MDQETLPYDWEQHRRSVADDLKRHWLDDQVSYEEDRASLHLRAAVGHRRRFSRPCVTVELPPWLDDDTAAEAPIAPVENR